MMTEYSTNMNKMRSTDFHHHHHHQICMPSYSAVPSGSSDIALSTINENYLVGQNTLNPTTSYPNTYAEMLTNQNESIGSAGSAGSGALFHNFYHQHQQTEYMSTSGQYMTPSGNFMTSSGYSYAAPPNQQTNMWTMDSLKKSSPSVVMNGGGYAMSHDETSTASSSVTTASSSGSSTPTAMTNLNGGVSQQLLKTSENNATMLTNLALADSSILVGKREENKSNVNSKSIKQLNRSKPFKEELQLCETENNNANTSNKIKRLGKKKSVFIITEISKDVFLVIRKERFSNLMLYMNVYFDLFSLFFCYRRKSKWQQAETRRASG